MQVLGGLLSWLVPLLFFVLGCGFGEHGTRAAGVLLEIGGVVLVLVRYLQINYEHSVPLPPYLDYPDSSPARPSLHDRVENLAHQVSGLFDRIAKAAQSTGGFGVTGRRAIAEAERHHRELVDELRETLNRILTGGILEVVGIGWILLGMIVANFSDVIAKHI